MPAQPTLFDALALASTVVDDLVVATARDAHQGALRRTHRVLRRGLGPRLGDVATPVEQIHSGVASLVYGAVGLSFRGAGASLGQVAKAGIGPALEDGPRGRFVNSAINGLIGDELRRERPRLAIEMAARSEGRDVVLTHAGVRSAYPTATGRIAVFVPGMCENESYWGLHRDRTGMTYPERLAGLGWTPVLVRGNSGLPIRENGVALSAVLQRVVENWPVAVDRIAVIGHSMGGLIARAALSVQDGGPGARSSDQRWQDLVTDAVTLGAPHLGAPLARAADRGAARMARVPELRGFGRILDRRAIGIRNLEDGLGGDVAAPTHVRFRLVSASLTTAPDHPVADVLGDLLVPPWSATGADVRRGEELFPGVTSADIVHLPRTDHFGLLNHPDVYRALERWLS